MAVQSGDKVKVHYTGKLEDGSVFDSSETHGQPLEFVAGSGQVIKGFDDGVMGMNPGDKKTITIPPEQAYGLSNPDMIQTLPKQALGNFPDVKPGTTLVVQGPDGGEFPVVVKAITATEVTLDMNHPLAGKTLIFEITLV